MVTCRRAANQAADKASGTYQSSLTTLTAWIQQCLSRFICRTSAHVVEDKRVTVQRCVDTNSGTLFQQCLPDQYEHSGRPVAPCSSHNSVTR